jgi:hypothetical protein
LEWIAGTSEFVLILPKLSQDITINGILGCFDDMVLLGIEIGPILGCVTGSETTANPVSTESLNPVGRTSTVNGG